MTCRSQPVVTGLAWMGSGCRSIESSMEQVVSSARSTLVVLAYRMSDGAANLLSLLRERLRAGVRITMVVNSLDTHHGNVPALLFGLLADYSDSFVLYEFRGEPGQELHAKAIIADDRSALIGSANLSWSGLVRNYELAVLLEGEDVAELATVARKILNAKEAVRLRAPLPKEPR